MLAYAASLERQLETANCRWCPADQSRARPRQPAAGRSQTRRRQSGARSAFAQRLEEAHVQPSAQSADCAREREPHLRPDAYAATVVGARAARCRGCAFTASRRQQRAVPADTQRRRRVAAQIRPFADAPQLGLACGRASPSRVKGSGQNSGGRARGRRRKHARARAGSSSSRRCGGAAERGGLSSACSCVRARTTAPRRHGAPLLHGGRSSRPCARGQLAGRARSALALAAQARGGASARRRPVASCRSALTHPRAAARPLPTRSNPGAAVEEAALSARALPERALRPRPAAGGWLACRPRSWCRRRRDGALRLRSATARPSLAPAPAPCPRRVSAQHPAAARCRGDCAPSSTARARCSRRDRRIAAASTASACRA
jgi:hypothetical protein